jgi:(p)ppGpp synthase/HD superfamily hydrolase
MKDLIQKAAGIMVNAHGEQTRKTDGSPYIVHPLMVAFKLKKHGFSEEIIAAGLCHDVLEDTDYPAEKLKKELGQKVYDIVLSLSEDKSLEWEDRKQAYIDSVKNSSEGSKAVSICDKIHNLESILMTYPKMGPAIWKKFNRGKQKKMWFEAEVLKMLKDHWSHPLVEEYESLIDKVNELN